MDAVNGGCFWFTVDMKCEWSFDATPVFFRDVAEVQGPVTRLGF